MDGKPAGCFRGKKTSHATAECYGKVTGNPRITGLGFIEWLDLSFVSTGIKIECE